MYSGKGIVRQIDPLGRLVIPKELREILGMGEKNPVSIYIEGERIIIEKYNDLCFICGSHNEIHSVEGKNICSDCVEKIKTIETNPQEKIDLEKNLDALLENK